VAAGIAGSCLKGLASFNTTHFIELLFCVSQSFHLFMVMLVALLLLALGFVPTARGFLPRCRRSTARVAAVAASSSPVSQRDAQSAQIQRTVAATAATAAAFLLQPRSAVLADKGGITASSLEESKKAVKQVSKMIDGINEMDALWADKKWQAIGDILGRPEFQTFDAAASTLTRSEFLSAEDRVALGTIKRYGVVADAIIMLGGLGAELKAGGVKVAGGGGAPINGPPIEEDDEDDDDDDGGSAKEPGALKVNFVEVKKYIKLSRDSLADIYRIVSPLLSK